MTANMSSRFYLCLSGTIAVAIATVLALSVGTASAQDSPPAISPAGNSQALNFDAAQWQRLEASVDRGLAWLVEEQAVNGCVGDSHPNVQPALTALAVMAALSAGHQPGSGPYGQWIERSVDYVLTTQDSLGFFVIDNKYNGSAATYNHAIAGIMLAEVLGMADNARNDRITVAIDRGLVATTKLQQRHQESKTDRGGWRYIKRNTRNDADLSVTTWHLLFLRAAKNAGYAVPESLVTEASNFVRRCYNEEQAMFAYLPDSGASITMTAAGVLSLYLAGQVDDPRLIAGAEKLAAYDFEHLNPGMTWPYYTCYHSSQAANQIDGKTRRKVLTGIATFLMSRQRNDGRWPATERVSRGGNVYATSMAILSLTPAYQILPIYQQ